MKILHVVDSMEVGGAETLVAQMCRMQRDQGHDPTVYAIAALGPLGEQLRSEGFNVQANIARHLSDGVSTLYRMFRNARPDVVHLHNPRPTIYASTAARMAGVPTIISTRHGLVNPPYNMLSELKYAIAAVSCDWIVGICDGTVNNLRSLRTLPRRKLMRVYNGVVPVERVPVERQPKTNAFTFLFVGRLAPVKNLGLLLNAFATACSSQPELSLWIVGDGSERTKLERIAQDRNLASHVTFWGQQLDIVPFFSAADAFIMSSESEGLPLSLLQAFSAGLPSIVTDVGGMAEVVRSSNGGVTVPVGDSDAMAKAMLRIVENPADRLAYGRCAQCAFDANFSLARMLAAYKQLYREAVPTHN